MSAAARRSSAGEPKRDNYSCRSVRYQSCAEYAAVNATCRDTQEPVEMLLGCNGEGEPSWSTDGHSCGSPAAWRNSAHWWWNRQNRGWCRPDYPSQMSLRTCGLLRPGSSGILASVDLKQSALRRFCEDRFLGFHAKTEIPGLIEGVPVKRGVGADRRLSLFGKPVLRPEPVRSRSYAHSPSACSPMARSDAHR